MTTTASIEVPHNLIPIFKHQRGDVRFRGAYGGRGSAKTRTFALMTAVFAYIMAEEGERGLILCGREFQNSLDESSMEEIKQAIRSIPWLENYFDIGERHIRTKNHRIRYIFAGLRHNIDSLKSKSNILLAWIDEAEHVSEPAYQKLLPTIRQPKSEIWVTWNPEKDESATDKRFIKQPPKDAAIAQVNYYDNPWFPEVLERERLRDMELLDDARYRHIWEGHYLENSDAQVMAGKYRIADFEPTVHWDGPYFGLDWGFANDPTAAVKCWIYKETLYIEHEAVKVNLELDQTADYVKERLPGIEQHVIRADCARPESISYVKRKGLPKIMSVDKWGGSVEDGIEHLRSYREIIIHPRCKETLKEFRMYSYKVDRNTGDVMPKIVDAYNHLIDSIRYALAPLIRTNKNRAGVL